MDLELFDSDGERFPENWQKDAETILTAAKALISAKNSYSSKLYKQFKKKHVISIKTAERLVKIGNDARLYEDSIKENLPNTYSVIELITYITDDRLKELASTGKLKNIKKKEVERIIGRSEAQADVDTNKTSRLLTIRADKAFTKNVGNQSKINKIISAVEETIAKFSGNTEYCDLFLHDHGIDLKIQKRIEILANSKDGSDFIIDLLLVVVEARRSMEHLSLLQFDSDYVQDDLPANIESEIKLLGKEISFDNSVVQLVFNKLEDIFVCTARDKDLRVTDEDEFNRWLSSYGHARTSHTKALRAISSSCYGHSKYYMVKSRGDKSVDDYCDE